ncbi:VIT domain-containing protein [Akkermansiaceae bacterium]|nr:VIT domain-containing protein [Akkermansiaceae bacterium]
MDYAVDVNGTRRAGVVVPAKRAKVAYEEIVRRRVDPGIVEIDEVKNEFRARVFPIPPSSLKTIWRSSAPQL